MRKDDRQLIIDILIKNNLLTPQQKLELEREEQETGKSIFDLIEEKKLVPEEIFTKIKSKFFNVPYLELKDKKIDKEVLELIPEEVAKNYKIIAFRRVGSEVGVAMLKPQDFQAVSALDFIARKKNIRFSYFITSRTALERALQFYDSIKEEVQ